MSQLRADIREQRRIVLLSLNQSFQGVQTINLKFFDEKFQVNQSTKPNNLKKKGMASSNFSDVEISDKERLLADPDEDVDDDDDDGASGLSSDYENSSVISSSG